MTTETKQRVRTPTEVFLRTEYAIKKYNCQSAGRVFGLNFEQFVEIVISSCDHCGKIPVLFQSYGLTEVHRRDNSFDYLPGNCQPLCAACNRHYKLSKAL